MSAVWTPATRDLLVTFDRALTADAGLDIGNWRYQSGPLQRWLMDSAVALGDATVQLHAVDQPLLLAGGLGLWYQPPPYDVLSAGGTPAAAFSEFPVTT